MKKRILYSSIIVTLLALIEGLAQIPCQAAELKIYCIDVNQGSATLILAPNGKSLLVDCGAQSTWESVRKIITETAGLTSVDYFVCTHYHDDHYGALKKLVDSGIGINGVFYDRDSEKWITESRRESGAYKNYKALSEGKREYLWPGKKIELDTTVDIDCVVANGRAKGEYGPIDYPADENGYSLGLLIAYNGFDFLIMGDLNEDVESKLASQGVLRDIDVYAVDHHGAETSSCQALLDVIKPEVCIISSGTNGTYKHPRKVAVERLQALPSVLDVFQLNKNVDAARYPGTIKNAADDHIGDLLCTGDIGTILLSVRTATYEARFCKGGPAREYQIQR